MSLGASLVPPKLEAAIEAIERKRREFFKENGIHPTHVLVPRCSYPRHAGPAGPHRFYLCGLEIGWHDLDETNVTWRGIELNVILAVFP